VYICHREDALTPVEETLQALDDVVRAGKVRYLGFSNWSAWAVSAALELQKGNNWARFTHGQMYYSMACRDVEYDVIPMMRKYGVGLTVWSPLSGGFLSGKYTRETLKDPNNRRASFDFPPVNLEQGFALLDVLRPMAQRHNATVAQVALAWLLANPATTSVLIGATKLSQLDDNLAAIDVQLRPEDLAEIDALTKLTPRYPNWFDAMVADDTMRKAMGR
jgi:aryl-alcohol dehydrogenase-like predicted oxidoreductase